MEKGGLPTQLNSQSLKVHINSLIPFIFLQGSSTLCD